MKHRDKMYIIGDEKFPVYFEAHEEYESQSDFIIESEDWVIKYIRKIFTRYDAIQRIIDRIRKGEEVDVKGELLLNIGESYKENK